MLQFLLGASGHHRLLLLPLRFTHGAHAQSEGERLHPAGSVLPALSFSCKLTVYLKLCARCLRWVPVGTDSGDLFVYLCVREAGGFF